MKTTTISSFLSFFAVMTILCACTNSKKQVPTHVQYYVKSLRVELKDAPMGAPAKIDDEESIAFGREIVFVKGEWVSIKEYNEDSTWVRIYNGRHTGWTEFTNVTTTYPINRELDLKEYQDYTILFNIDYPKVQLYNYYIYYYGEDKSEEHLLDVASSLRYKFAKQHDGYNQIWLMDERISEYMYNSDDLTDEEYVYIADHLIYSLTKGNNFGTYYPSQENYEEYKSKGGKNYKRTSL